MRGETFPDVCLCTAFQSLSWFLSVVAAQATPNVTVSSDVVLLREIGIGIYILIGIWAIFLAAFALGVRAVRARQISGAVLSPLLIIPALITLILVLIPRFPSKQVEIEETQRRRNLHATFNAYYNQDIRIVLVVVCGLLAVVTGGAYLWSCCFETARPKKLHFQNTVSAKQELVKLGKKTL